jgi:hypothetical protein
MTAQRRARIIGLLGGFAAGLANALFYLARNMDNTPLWDWISVPASPWPNSSRHGPP